MPVTSSAIKKDRQDKKTRIRNRAIRDGYRIAIKNVRKLAKEGETKKAGLALKEAYSKIDKAAKKKVLHKNKASRKKSRLSALLKKASVDQKKADSKEKKK